MTAEAHDYKHPSCTCDELDHDDESLATLELAKVMENVGMQVGSQYPLCRRQLAMACVIIAASQFHMEGRDEAGIREEMQQAIDVVLANRSKFMAEEGYPDRTIQ